MRKLGIFVFAMCIAVGAFGQGRGSATTRVGGKQISIDYGQPALKGRSFGDLVKQLPGDRMWRAGAGVVTILTSEADLLVGGKAVPAGVYSVYIHCPETGNYSLVLNRDLGQPLGKIWAAAPANRANEPYPHFEYTKEIGNQEVARVPLKHASAPPADLLRYSFQPSGNGAVLTIAWGDQAWSTEIKTAR